jgi:dienelactone hydrolase
MCGSRALTWLLHGQPLAYAVQPGPACATPDAVIPAELAPGPILLISARQDRVWPAAPMARAISDRLKAAGHAHGHLLLEYPAAGHSLGYLIPSLPPACSRPASPTSRRTRPVRADAWPKTLQFLQRLRDGDAAQAR